MADRDTEHDLQLGSRLRRHRQAQGLSLAAVAEASGVTKGFLSQLERGLSRASVASLRRIGDAVGISIAELLGRPPGPLDSTNAPAVNFGGTGARDRLLTPVGFPHFQVLHATVDPGGNHVVAEELREESHLVYVLDGSFTLVLDEKEHRLKAGQSLAFQTPGRYGWRNDTDQTTEVLWTFSPAVL
jgi:transcriptional regulator with XRE-family HTH domain